MTRCSIVARCRIMIRRRAFDKLRLCSNSVWFHLRFFELVIRAYNESILHISVAIEKYIYPSLFVWSPRHDVVTIKRQTANVEKLDKRPLTNIKAALRTAHRWMLNGKTEILSAFVLIPLSHNDFHWKRFCFAQWRFFFEPGSLLSRQAPANVR